MSVRTDKVMSLMSHGSTEVLKNPGLQQLGEPVSTESWPHCHSALGTLHSALLHSDWTSLPDPPPRPPPFLTPPGLWLTLGLVCYHLLMIMAWCAIDAKVVVALCVIKEHSERHKNLCARFSTHAHSYHGYRLSTQELGLQGTPRVSRRLVPLTCRKRLQRRLCT